MGEVGWAWAVLGIHPNSPKEVVKRAYYKLAKKIHPDKSTPAENEKMQKINEAYEIIRKIKDFK